MLDQLEELPGAGPPFVLGQRLREALEHVERKGSADALDEELKYLADMDAGRAARQLCPGADHHLGHADARIPRHGGRYHAGAG